MERDTLVGHGASLLLKERMLDQSDKADVWICRNCGDVGSYDYIKNQPTCQTCGQNELEKVEISYGFKLLLDEGGDPLMKNRSRPPKRSRMVESTNLSASLC